MSPTLPVNFHSSLLPQFLSGRRLLYAAIALQFIILLSLIFFYQGILLGGREVILATEPIDPRDILRGQYVALRYDISRLDTFLLEDAGASEFEPGQNIFVILESGEDGVWEAVGVMASKPEGEIFIKGMVTSADDYDIEVSYGIESYFVDPEKAKELEAESRQGNLFMRVVVDKEGRGVIRGTAKIQGAPSGIGGAQMQSLDARRIADIKQLQLALELYFDSNGEYPEMLEDVEPEFIPRVPRDQFGQGYYYFKCSDTSYHMGADLENRRSAALASDSDVGFLCDGDSIQGADGFSCSGDVGRFCFDVVEGLGSFGGVPEDLPRVVPPPIPPDRQ